MVVKPTQKHIAYVPQHTKIDKVYKILLLVFPFPIKPVNILIFFLKKSLFLQQKVFLPSSEIHATKLSIS